MKNTNARQLLNKYLSGTCTEMEKALLETWYLKQHGEDLPEISVLEKEKQLNEIWLNLPIHAKERKINMLWRKIAVSAIVLITIGIAGILYTQKDIHESENRYAVKDIRPGENKAILTLADGTKINLSGKASGLLAEQSGIKITKASDGQLVYTVTDPGKHLSADDEEQFNTIETPVGGQYMVNLPDGTKVWLNAATTLKYPVQFSKNSRSVKLIGEGYFEVFHDQERPFYVSGTNQTVEVLGTHFNFMDYPDETVAKTTLVEGSVKVIGNKKSKILIPGQQSRLINGRLTVADQADIEEAIAWKNGYFKFNEDLRSVMNKISRWYGVDISYEIDPDADLVFGGKISRTRNLSAVLKIIEYTGKVHFKIEERRVTVTK